MKIATPTNGVNDLERAEYGGPNALTDMDVLTLLIGPETKKLKTSNISDLSRYTFQDLRDFGLSKAACGCLIAAFEIQARKVCYDKIVVRSSKDAFSIIGPKLADLPHEEFWVIGLSRANAVEWIYRISAGGTAGTVVDAKIIFREVINRRAVSVILVHNHPSGNLKPSDADIDLTKKLVNAGYTLDIAVLDHLIVSDRGYYSFSDEGIMPHQPID